MPWRFSANDTHLYPGALLRSLDTPGERRLAPDDDVVVAFSDDAVAPGRLARVTPDAAVLRMSAYRTQRGTHVAARTWEIVPNGVSGLAKVRKRVD